ncbi:hypothetical protein HRE53_31435 (plasmid) [Acaryochloris sp. 'Moss Beach']|uniref:hypothetical protein n=1 Tax=Acaryochloris sp. 'Moss Beach' TaxID=2740837 RepID=UPI001F33199D|nr:hypothetical protein [Acaryochloris sp. 'Moss Beach']UJB73089.1 hypothetical protein HRE53_31435 [Acaryochloris sp. 'Moss Beach']
MTTSTPYRDGGKAIRQAYVRGYRRALIALTASDGFGLDVETLGVQEIMDIPYQALHPGESAPLGQYIRTDDHSQQPEVIIQDYGDHDLGAIFEPYQGLPTTPDFTRSTVYIPSTGKHWAFVRLGKVRHYPVDGQSVPRGYLKFLWTRLTTPHPILGLPSDYGANGRPLRHRDQQHGLGDEELHEADCQGPARAKPGCHR